MPTPQSDEPLRKITLRIFESDHKWYKRHYGEGWQTQIRELARNWRNTIEARNRALMESGDE